ncbi:(+)-cis,trans-nepetalactol synthase NEPS2-like [Rhodamnia argentea]|uniref:(+)-cis,trans-nepetalactol synthase NEPS2-like n=1 Tax=Rhodamnia argentea TaxID=178133 RepID=A0ABM3HR43_9MYRT|nr:(+)-cis,trans-nepetalactol synthase NEPS2-like [Rhodamnia argentea]
MAETISSSSKMNKLQGKVVIVTGGASGIGEAAARLFAAHGARMVVIADVQETGREVAASIGTSSCTYVRCDVTDELQVESLVRSTVNLWGRLDVMFSNVGVVSGCDQTVLDLDLGRLDRVMAVNVRGMAACVKHAARAMVEGRVRGSIVCTSSVMGRTGGARNTDYHMSKHALAGLVRSASVQLGAHGIRVNSVSPYAVATPGLCGMLGMEAEEAERAYGQYVCLKGGEPMKARHVAEAALFLTSDEAAFVTGHDLVVDGGFLHQPFRSSQTNIQLSVPASSSFSDQSH